MLRNLAVFRGGFTTEAVGAVCFEDSIDELQVLDYLADLNAKSLVTTQIGDPGTRFRQLEMIREYAAIRLHNEGRFEEVNRRHRKYFTALALREQHRLATADQLEALQVLEADHDNLRAVMRRSLAEENFDAAVDVARRLTWFWYLHSHFAEGEIWAQELLGAIPDEPGRPWLSLLIGASLVDFRIGQYDRADERLQQALELAVDQNSPRLQMWAHAYRASNEFYRAQVDETLRHAEKAIQIANDIGDLFGLGYAIFMSVSAEALLQDSKGELSPEVARDLLGRLLPVSSSVRAAGERNMIGHVLQTEGVLAARAGDTEKASRSFDTAIQALAELGQVGCACHCLEAIAQFAASAGEHRSAAAITSAADRLRAQVGIRFSPFEKELRAVTMSMAAEEFSTEVLEAAESDGGAFISLQEATQLARQTVARI